METPYRLRAKLMALATFASDVSQQLYIDGVYARIVIRKSGNPVSIDSVDGGSFYPIGATAAQSDQSGFADIVFPIVYDANGVPIPYDQRMVIRQGKGAGANLAGYVLILYVV